MESAMEKRCAACGQAFEPNPRIRNQIYCPSPMCQRERRRRWQQQKRRDDVDYRDNDARSRKSWANENPEYWKQYRGENPDYAERNRSLQQARNHKLRTSVIANEDASRPFNQLPAGRYRMVRISTDGAASEDVWIVEITVLAAITATEDV
jgi:hypothetical protein